MRNNLDILRYFLSQVVKLRVLSQVLVDVEVLQAK